MTALILFTISTCTSTLEGAGNLQRISSLIFENVTAKWTFCVQQFSKVAIIKTKSATIASFWSRPFPSRASLFLFLLSFSLVSEILELKSRPKSLHFRSFWLKWLLISLRWFSKNWLDLHSPWLGFGGNVKDFFVSWKEPRLLQ